MPDVPWLRRPTGRPQNPIVALVVEHDAQRRTVWLSSERSTTDLRIRLGPTRLVPIGVQCAETSSLGEGEDPEEARWPRFEAFWQPGDDLWASLGIPPQGTAPSLDPSVPNLELPHAGGSVPEGARTFAVELPLPVGSSSLVIDGPCGIDIRELEVADEEGSAPPVRVELTHPDSGTLEIELTGRWTASGHPVIHMRAGPHQMAPLRVEVGSPRRRCQLQPGRYVLGPGQPTGCLRTVEVRPSETTRLEIPANGCLVTQAGVHRAW